MRFSPNDMHQSGALIADAGSEISPNGIRNFGMPIALLDRSRIRPDHATVPGPMMAFSAAMDLIDG
jgi:hypothetical protein